MNNTNEGKANDIIFPDISDELILALQRTFPNVIPDYRIDDYQLGILQGEQRVIKKLISEQIIQE